MTSRRLHDVGSSGWWQAAWFLIRVFSVGLLGALLNPYSGSGFSAVWVITEPVLPGTILSLVITSIGLLSYNDVGISGWWQLDYISAFSPIWIAIGVPSVWAIVWTVRRSDDGSNKYGPDPRQATATPRLSDIERQLMEMIQRGGGRISAGTAAEEFGVTPEQVRRTLQDLARRGLIRL